MSNDASLKSAENVVFHAEAFAERKNFIKFIASLGSDKMQRIFKFPGEDFSLWWLSLVAEKAVIKSDAYENLVAYLCSGKQKTVPKSNKKKNNLILNFAYGFWTLCSLSCQAVSVWLKARNFKKRKANLSSSEYIMVSYFPHIDARQLAKGNFLNNYLPAFHKTLKDSAAKYSHICLPVDIDGFGFRDSARLLNKFQDKESLFLLQEFLNFGDLFLSFGYYLYFTFGFIFNLNWIKKQLRYTYKGNSFAVWNLFKGDFYQSFAGNNLATAIIYMLSFKKLVSKISPKAKIITVCEMQWWEKALYLYARKHKLTTIGYQHCQVPVLLLNYFNAPEEIKDGPLPLPDYLAAVGKITQQMFCESGWPDKRVFIWGAQRFEPLRNLEGLFVPWQEKEEFIVCALPVDAWETKEILCLLREAFSASTGYKIMLKSHPTVNLKKIIRGLGFNFDPETFVVVEGPLDILMKKAKAMIVTKSSACFYALASGSYVIVPRFPGVLDCNPLSYLTVFPAYAYSASELRGICDGIINSRQSPSFYEQGKNFLRDYFYFPETDSEYLTKIKNLNN